MEIDHSEYCVLGTDIPLNIRWAKKNNLVSGNAGDKKNLHPGGRRNFLNLLNKVYT